MFDNLSKKNKKVIYTKDELKKAVSSKEPEIIVGGDLANKLKWIPKLSIVKIGMLIATLTAAIPTMGTSFAVTSSFIASSSVAGIAGKDVAIIIFSSGLSITLILSILKGYNVEIETNTIKLIARQK